MFQKIVVGLDGSDASETALRVACGLAGKYGADVYLVHTPQPQTVAFAMGAVAGYHAATTMPSDAEVKKAADKILSRAADIANEYDCTIAQAYSERGNPVDEIVGCAEKNGADLIVTGRRGLGGIASLVQGSTTQGVNHHAKCACLSVV